MVLPEPLLRDALNARKMFPEKKVIVHFMQPHVPFIESDYEQSPNNPQSEESNVQIENNPRSEIERAEMREIPKDDVIQNYNQNLGYVKPHIEKLSEELEGKTAITSDHGELLGEEGIWGHPRNSKAKVLRRLPWEVRD